ncbi:MAG: hypothetical protein SFU25_03855 [Candidatus Caenarcaniphilales bacterium]|nr:hypothetical protein [Candidatus Caenarcaniphilales bacterium]
MISEVILKSTKSIQALIEQELAVNHSEMISKIDSPESALEKLKGLAKEAPIENLQGIQNITKTEEAPAPVLIENWLSDEGFDVHEHEKTQKELYKFAFERNTEKFHRDYIIEVCDFGRAIKKVKMRIV